MSSILYTHVQELSFPSVTTFEYRGITDSPLMLCVKLNMSIFCINPKLTNPINIKCGTHNINFCSYCMSYACVYLRSNTCNVCKCVCYLCLLILACMCMWEIKGTESSFLDNFEFNFTIFKQFHF